MNQDIKDSIESVKDMVVLHEETVVIDNTVDLNSEESIFKVPLDQNSAGAVVALSSDYKGILKVGDIVFFNTTHRKIRLNTKHYLIMKEDNILVRQS